MVFAMLYLLGDILSMTCIGLVEEALSVKVPQSVRKQKGAARQNGIHGAYGPQQRPDDRPEAFLRAKTGSKYDVARCQVKASGSLLWLVATMTI